MLRQTCLLTGRVALSHCHHARALEWWRHLTGEPPPHAGLYAPLMSTSSVTGKRSTACSDGNYHSVASDLLPLLLSATVISAMCTHNKYACLPVSEKAAASGNPSEQGGSGDQTGSLAGIIKLFLFYTLSSCWCQGLHHLLVS